MITSRLIPKDKGLYPIASRRGGGGGHHRLQRSGETAGVSGPVRTGAGGMARGEGTGGTGESEEGESQILNIKY